MIEFKKLNRIFIQENLFEGKLIESSPDHFHYLSKVLRKKTGDHILLFNPENGEYLSSLEYDNKKIFFKIIKKYREKEKLLNLIYLLPLVKPEKQSLMIDMAVQLGVEYIIPTTTDYTQISNFNFKRAEKIALEATEQSGRINITKFYPSQKLDKILENFKEYYDVLIWACERDNNAINIFDNIAGIYKNILKNKKIALLIGPEGGFSDREKKLLNSYENNLGITLGKNILRSETASCALITIISNILLCQDNQI